MHRKFYKALLRRRIFVIFLLLLQMGLIIAFLLNTGRQFEWVGRVLGIASVFVVLYAVVKREYSAYRLIWSLLILVFPFFGGLFYLLFRFQGGRRRFNEALEQLRQTHQPLYRRTGNCLDEARRLSPGYATLMTYLQNFAGFPVYRHTRTTYFPSGEAKFTALMAALEQAKHYIFLEYFIIEEGRMWDAVLKILKQKAEQGVDVRIIYDDVGCFLKLPKDYDKRLASYGIQCVVFGPVIPVLTARQNNRDHRKIAVIDGKVAFTGGVNLADEYINAIDRFGHWKDTAVMLEGEAAWCFALIFLEMWAVCTATAKSGVEDTEAFAFSVIEAVPTDVSCEERVREEKGCEEKGCEEKGCEKKGREEMSLGKFIPRDYFADGLAQPYADSPMDNERVGEHVYLHIINSAKRYVYINTPYLVVDDTMIAALCFAAKSGVDVRIVTPRRPDKWYVHMTTRSYYRDLIRAGVRVYEYADGFIHAKSFVSDDAIATVGTANLDYRSLYLHFECGVCLYGCRAVGEIRDDFLATLTRCVEVSEADGKSGFFTRLVQETLRLFAPLM